MQADYDSQARFRVHYDEPMLRDAVRHFVWRRLFIERPLLWLVGLGMLGMLLYRLYQGEGGWLSALLAFSAVLPALLVGAIWRAHHLNTIGQFRRLREPQADVVVDAQNWSFASDLGSASLPWTRLTGVWRRPGYWMLFWGPGQFNVLPDAPLPQDLRDELARLAR